MDGVVAGDGVDDVTLFSFTVAKESVKEKAKDIPTNVVRIAKDADNALTFTGSSPVYITNTGIV